jgi:hypothetical protein
VLFAQRLQVSPPSTFSMAMRLQNRAQNCGGRFEAGRVSINIFLMEGVKAGLRTFQRRLYTRSGALPHGSPRLLSDSPDERPLLKRSKATQSLESYRLTAILVAEYGS